MIVRRALAVAAIAGSILGLVLLRTDSPVAALDRSEEHTSELQSLTNLVCRLLLEKKKNKIEDKCFTHYQGHISSSKKLDPHGTHRDPSLCNDTVSATISHDFKNITLDLLVDTYCT